MNEIDFTGIALVLAALSPLVAAIAGAAVIIIQARQGKIIQQVEKQGNAVSLELRRTNMVYAMRLAAAERTPGNIAIADEARKVYEEALKQTQIEKEKG